VFRESALTWAMHSLLFLLVIKFPPRIQYPLPLNTFMSLLTHFSKLSLKLSQSQFFSKFMTPTLKEREKNTEQIERWSDMREGAINYYSDLRESKKIRLNNFLPKKTTMLKIENKARIYYIYFFLKVQVKIFRSYPFVK
jgi:hypothetical protein